ncbi:MAG: hypothetical protein ACYTFZ_08435 [Planctomycetota bacterium]|jgi:hypothetical protein
MSDAYATALTAVKDALDTTIKTASSFSVRTYFDYVKSIDAYPTCRVRLVRDVFNARGPKVSHHYTTFRAEVLFLGTGTEANLNTIIGYVGEIVDVIEASRTLGTSYVENTEVTSVDYSYSERRDGIRYYAYMIIEVEHIRNA